MLFAGRILTLLLSVFIPLVMFGAPASNPPYLAAASMEPRAQYLNDTTGTVFNFRVHNTGASASIGAVAIEPPSASWTIIACPQAPAGWITELADSKCRYRSANIPADDIQPGQQVSGFQLRATAIGGNADYGGTWRVTVSQSNQFDNESQLLTAVSESPGLDVTVYSWEVLDAVVASGPATPGSACPAPSKQAISGSMVAIVICGRNRTSADVTPTAALSSLSATFVASPGTFSSAVIAKNTTSSVVLGNWTGVQVTSSPGPDKTVSAQIGSATNSTSPSTTLAGYEAKYKPPLAANDSYSVNEDSILNVSAPGVLANDSDPNGEPLSIVLVSSPAYGTLSAVLVSGPAHGTLTLNADGSFTYAPAANFNVPDSFTYKARNTFGDESSPATVNIAVNPMNDVPVAANDSYGTDEDTALNVTGPGVLENDTDVDGDALNAVLASGPAYGALTMNPDGSFTYMPNANYNGPDSFTYKANDGTADSDIATVALSINSVDDVPVPNNDVYNTDEDTTLNVAAPGVLANDTDVENSTLTAVLVIGPAHGALTLNANGSFSYTPGANFNGSDSFTYKANDGAADSNVATVSITVNSMNDVPVAGNDSYSTNEDTPLDVAAPGLLANDIDGDGDSLSAVLVTGPANGTLVLNAKGTFSYTPDASFNGSDSFTYRAFDGTANSNITTVSITINAVNDSPVANNDTYSTDEDTSLNVPAAGVLANDTDVESSPLTANLVSGPTHGTLTLNANGSFSYTPNANYSGGDSFTYRANDGAADSDVATANISVNPINDVPAAADDSYATNEDVALAVNAPGILGNDTDGDGDALTAMVVTGPAHGALTLNANGSFSYAPAANYNGPDGFTYKAYDGLVDSNVATVNITVNAVNDPPDANNDSYNNIGPATLNESAPGVLANDTDVENSPLTAVLVSGPTNAASFALDSDGSFSYTANPGATSDSFTYKANDGEADSNVATVTISINAAPVADAQSVSTNEDTAKTITLSGSDAEDADLSFSIVTGPTHGTLGSLGAPDCSAPNTCTAQVTYTPATNYNGLDSFTLAVNDISATSADATVSITVNPVNDPSVAANDSYTTDEDTPLNVVGPGVLANDTDVDGDSLTAVLVTDPAHGTLTLHADGSFSYTPAANYNGSDSFTYKANDGAADSNLATVSITIGSVNDAPVNTVPTPQTVNEDTDLVFSTANGNALSVADVDAAPGALQVTVSALNGTITPGSGSGATIGGSGTASASITGTSAQVNAALNGLKYRGIENWNSTRGSETLTVVTNDQGNTGTGGPLGDTATVGITVNAVNDAPIALAKNYNAQANMMITGLTGLLAGATDPDTGDGGYTASFTVGTVDPTSPALGTVTIVNSATGSFDFDPPPGATGSVTFTYTVCDSGNPAPAVCSAPATVTVNVAGPVIWFVNPVAVTNGDGRLSGPFNNLASPAAVDASGHRIFVYGGTAAGGITLNANEWLIGQGVSGASFDALFGISPPAGTMSRPAIGGTRPVIQGNIVMATSDAVRGLNIQPASGTAGLTASAATGLTVGEASVTTISATAVSLASSGGTISLTSVNANGGSRGILLNSTTGTFAVTGTGTAGSGGTIQNTSSEGIALANVQNVSLDRMIIHDTGRSGINGTQVTNFSFSNGTINNSATAAVGGSDDANISFNDSTTIGVPNVTGVVSVINSTLTNSRFHGFDIQNHSGTVDNLVITGNTFTSAASLALSNGSAVRYGGQSASAHLTRASLNNNTITNFVQGAGFVLQTNGGNIGIAGDSVNNISVTGNTMDGGNLGVGSQPDRFVTAAAGGGGPTSGGQGNFDISNNGTVVSPVKNIDGVVIELSAFGVSNVTANISNNYTRANNTVASAGIAPGADDTATLTATISGNNVGLTDGQGIFSNVRNGATGKLAIKNNTVAAPNTTTAARSGIQVSSGSSGTLTGTVCLDIQGNTAAGSTNSGTGSTSPGVALRKQASTNPAVFGIEGMAATATPGVETYVNGLNTSASGTFGVGGTALLSGTTGFTNCSSAP